MVSTKISPVAYRGEYDYRQGFAFERPLPDYLTTLVEAAADGLRKDDSFSAVAEINLGLGLPKFRLTLDVTGMTLNTQIGDTDEDTYRPASRFSELGGIRDILAGLVSGGGLPAEVSSDQIHIELQ